MSYHEVFAVHRKNCDPFVLGPAFAIDRIPEMKYLNLYQIFQN
jgi:hypothetical protein